MALGLNTRDLDRKEPALPRLFMLYSSCFPDPPYQQQGGKGLNEFLDEATEWCIMV
jgi:hypothetical protein